MVITYLGHEFFRVQFGDTVLAFNPISKESKLKTSRFGADIALVSANTPDTNGIDQISFGEREAFIIEGPGEYEVGGIFIKGFLSAGTLSDGVKNTIYTVSLEGMNICFLGSLPSNDIGSETKSALGDVDILFTPIGGGEVLSAPEAYKLAVSLGARLVIPMNYDAKALDAFLKEGGVNKVEPVDKLTLKKKDLDGKEGDIVVISPSNA